MFLLKQLKDTFKIKNLGGETMRKRSETGTSKIVEKAYSFRIVPNKEQKELINKNIGCTRFVFNHFLAKAKEDKYQSYTFYSSQLPQLKKEYEWLKEVDSISLQQSLKDLDKAFKRFFSGLAGFPKFKSKRKHRQSYRTQYFKRKSGTESIEIKGDKIKLPKLGWVKFRKSREVKGEIQNVTIRKPKTGKYYISICVQEQIKELPQIDKAIGIDLGIEHFLATSDGQKIENPQVFRKYEKKISRLQKKLSKKRRR